MNLPIATTGDPDGISVIKVNMGQYFEEIVNELKLNIAMLEKEKQNSRIPKLEIISMINLRIRKRQLKKYVDLVIKYRNEGWIS